VRKSSQIKPHNSRAIATKALLLEAARQESGVATVQPVLRAPTDGSHLLGLTLLALAQFLNPLVSQSHFGNALVLETLFPDARARMRSRYRINEPDAAHFITSTVVAWLPVFTTQACCDILARSFAYCREHKRACAFMPSL